MAFPSLFVYVLIHSLALVNICLLFSESDFKSLPMKPVYKFSSTWVKPYVVRVGQGLEVVVINSWNMLVVLLNMC